MESEAKKRRRGRGHGQGRELLSLSSLRKIEPAMRFLLVLYRTISETSFTDVWLHSPFPRTFLLSI